MPSYLVAKTAMVAQGNVLQQQFMQNLWAENKKGFYVNQLHSNSRYQSDLAFNDYGFGFKAEQNSTLFGGYLPLGERSELHAGVGFSKQKVTPNAADGESQASYKTTSLLLGLHNQWGQNGVINSYLDYHWHSGKISAQESKESAKVKGKQFSLRSELGYRVPFGQFSLTPVVGVGYQQLTMAAQDHLAQNWQADFTPYRSFTALAGSYFNLDLDKLRLKAGMFYEHNIEHQGSATLIANQQQTFKQGRLGSAVLFKGEAEYAFSPNVKLSLNASHRNGVAKGKLKRTQIGAQLSYLF